MVMKRTFRILLPALLLALVTGCSDGLVSNDADLLVDRSL
ncbi:MAG: hypothetical protein ACI80V_001239 [Rhodothermales bacterium]|jgi:hypothetical protein